MPVDRRPALQLQDVARGEVDEQQAGARIAQEGCPGCCRSGCRGNRGWPACRPARRRSPAGRRDATCRGRRSRRSRRRERLATKKVSDAVDQRRAPPRRARRAPRPRAGERGARRRACASGCTARSCRSSGRSATVRPVVDRDQAAVGAVAPPRGEVEAEQADLGAGDEGRRRRDRPTRAVRRCGASPDRAIARSPSRRSAPRPSASRARRAWRRTGRAAARRTRDAGRA